ncbi:hypothetical protein KFE96_17390 [Kordiimonas sp. SCSIO 12603]|uniref:B3/B4 domain-containing protein n=1 Tax=Kordiimonas sp. SCSIO 12603 TaxID=2829596 RepID=UPI002106E0EF|nr:phenylalanine--tRNA ligase beta subunit-related protein [Kordiimonas sp. SCSIO 12603]UTW58570.1 hypothetical protein KFE96_17390 [Kordiimonas sp. SCSIO 12603]
MQLHIDPIFSQKNLPIHMGILDYSVEVKTSGPALIHTMEDGAEVRMQELLGEAASADPVINAVRTAFKTLGKDPSRYRPSSEALTRRVLAGKNLYLVNNIVDCGNLVSLMTGVPVGCYDADKISGDITLRKGHEGESYPSVSKGNINIENLPLLADDNGSFGTPFSDSARTAITPETTKLLFVLYGINIDVEHIEAAAEIADTLISRFCTPD